MDLLREHGAIPLRWDDGFVIIGATNPLDIELIQALQFAIYKPLKLVVVEGSELAELHEIYAASDESEPEVIVEQVDKSKNKIDLKITEPKKLKKNKICSSNF